REDGAVLLRLLGGVAPARFDGLGLVHLGNRYTTPISRIRSLHRKLRRMEKREEWRARVEAWRASGQGLAEFCRGKGFTPSNLRSWVKRLDAAGDKAVSPSERPRIARVVRSRRGGASEGGGTKGRGASGLPRPAADVLVVEVGPMRVSVPAALETG